MAKPPESRMTQLIPALCFSLILVITFCHKKQSSRILDEELFVKIYCDVAMQKEPSPPETQTIVRDSIFVSYQVTKENFRATIEYYKRHPEQWRHIFQKIVAELEVREKVEANRKNSASLPEPGL